MTRTIEIKHVAPRAQVRDLIDALIDRIGSKLTHYAEDAVNFHVLFEENGTHKIFRTNLTCHTPGYTAAAHEEGRDPGMLIRKAFDEVERQVDKHNAKLRHHASWNKPPKQWQDTDDEDQSDYLEN
jgi:ribosome-associated translation inhibitor RaiA